MSTRSFNAASLTKEELWHMYSTGRLRDLGTTINAGKKRWIAAIPLAFIIGVFITYVALNSFKSPKFKAASVTAFSVAENDELYAEIKAKEVKKPELPELSREALYTHITQSGIICPNVVLAQATIESALLTTGSSPKTNNLFGMRYPSVRPTKAIGLYFQGKDSIIYGTQKELRKHLKHPTYAVYAHWTDAVADYKMWQDYSFKTRTKYLEFLGRVYATEPTYTATLQKMVD